MKQINLKLSEALKEKIFERKEFDETFTEEEIKLVGELIEKSIRNKRIKTEKELEKVLR